MSSKIYFKNIKKYSDYISENNSKIISSLSFVSDLELFDIKEYINPYDYIALNENNNEFIIFVQPDVEKLAKSFNIDLSQKKVNNIFEAAEIILSLKETVNTLLIEIEKFINERKNFFEYFDVKNLNQFNKWNEDENYEVKCLLRELKRYYGTFTLTLDHINEPKNENISSDIEIYKINSYASLIKKLKELYINLDNIYKNQYKDNIKKLLENKFLNKEERKDLEQILFELNEDFDDILESEYYKPEILAMICLSLEDFATKEIAINKFIETIKSNKLKTIEIFVEE